MATLQERLDKLNDMIAAGVRSATLGEQTLTYNTTASLIEARNDVLNQINNAAQGAAPRSRQTYAYQSGRGYD